MSASHPRFHGHHHSISADGKCDQPMDTADTLDKIESLDTLEIIIDGNSMTGGSDSPNLLGSNPDFLPASGLFSLHHFEPLPDGRCLLQYRKN